MSDGLPRGWTWVTINDLAAPEPNALTDGPFGSNLKTEHYTDAGPRVLRLQNIGDGVFIDAASHISHAHFARLRRYDVRSGDVVLAILGDPLPRACLPPQDLGPAIIKADCPRLRVDQRVTSPKFAMYVVNADSTRRRAAAFVHGVGRPRLNLSELRGVELPLPPVNEQTRIVDTIETQLTRLDAAVVALERVRASLKRYRASVLKAAVEGRLVPTEAELARQGGRDYEPASVLLQRILAERRRRWEESELAAMKVKGKTPKDDKWTARYKEPVTPDTTALPELPEGWCWASLESLCVTVTDGDHQPPPQTDVGIPFLVIGNIHTGRLDFSDIRFVPQEYYETIDQPRRPLRGDVLFSVTGSFGIPVIVDTDQKFCVQRHIAILKPTSEICGKLLSYFLGSEFIFTQAAQVATGTAQKTVPLRGLRAIVVPLPPLAEAHRILSEIERLFSLAEEVSAFVEVDAQRCKRLRQSVLKWAFEGKLVDQDPNDEPAAVLLDRIRAERNTPVSRAAERPRARKRRKTAA